MRGSRAAGGRTIADVILSDLGRLMDVAAAAVPSASVAAVFAAPAAPAAPDDTGGRVRMFVFGALANLADMNGGTHMCCL